MTSLFLPLGSSTGSAAGLAAGFGFTTGAALTSLISSFAGSAFLLGDLPRVLRGSSFGASIFFVVFGAAGCFRASTLG